MLHLTARPTRRLPRFSPAPVTSVPVGSAPVGSRFPGTCAGGIAWLLWGSLLCVGAASGQDVRWGGAVDGRYLDPTRWAGGVVPNQAAAGDRFNAIIDLPNAQQTYEVEIDGDVRVDSIVLGSPNARINHSSGRVEADTLQVQRNNYILRGGTIAGATIRSNPSSIFTPGRFVVAGGNGVLENVTLAGPMFVGGTTSTAGFQQVGDASIVGGLRLSGGDAIRYDSPGGSLELVGQSTIQRTPGGVEAARIVMSQAGSASALLTADAGGLLTIAGGVELSVRSDGLNRLGQAGASLINDGGIELEFGTSLLVAGDRLVNRGTVTLGETSIMSIDGAAWENESGIVGGGTVDGLVVNGGTIAPGFDSAGVLTIDSLTQTPQGVLSLGLGGRVAATQYDRVVVADGLVLGGTIDVDLTDGFMPVLGDEFDVLDWSQLTPGNTRFDFADAVLTGGLLWDTSSFAATGLLRVTAVPEPSVALVGCACVLGRCWSRRKRRPVDASVQLATRAAEC